MSLDLKLSHLLNSSGALLLVGLILIIGIFSGLYPALHLASFEPLNVLRSRPRQYIGKTHFRSGLVVFQLFISMAAITMTGIVGGQYRYLIHKDLGFEKKNILIIRRPDGLKNKIDDYKRQISTTPGVISVSNSTGIPGSSFSHLPYYLQGSPVTRNYNASTIMVSHSFDSTYKFRMREGRFFKVTQHADSAACVINESMARQLGGNDLIGKTLVQLNAKHDRKYEFRIIGIVKDFNYDILENPVQPMVMMLVAGNPEGYLSVKLNSNDPQQVIQNLKTVWEKFTTAYPFVSYYLDNDLHDRYTQVRKTGRIFSVLSIVSMLIACLGLFGLVSYVYSCRGYEIGIRKAMGANPGNIMIYQIRKIIRLLLVSSILAWIGVYFLVNSWLQGYSYSIDLNALYFFAPFLSVLLISVFTVYYQAYLAAHINPGPVLKYE